MSKQITIRELEKPKAKKMDSDIFWLCDSFGYLAGRDTEMISIKIIEELIKKFAEDRGIASENIASELDVSQSRVNHHIRNLMESGFLYRDHKLIFLRGGSVKSAVEEIRKDANRIFDEMEKIAESIDDSVGLKNRN